MMSKWENNIKYTLWMQSTIKWCRKSKAFNSYWNVNRTNTFSLGNASCLWKVARGDPWKKKQLKHKSTYIQWAWNSGEVQCCTKSCRKHKLKQWWGIGPWDHVQQIKNLVYYIYTKYIILCTMDSHPSCTLVCACSVTWCFDSLSQFHQPWHTVYNYNSFKLASATTHTRKLCLTSTKPWLMNDLIWFNLPFDPYAHPPNQKKCRPTARSCLCTIHRPS